MKYTCMYVSVILSRCILIDKKEFVLRIRILRDKYQFILRRNTGKKKYSTRKFNLCSMGQINLNTKHREQMT